MQNQEELSEAAYTVRFPRELLEHVRAWAANDRRSINQEIVWIVEQYERERLRTENAAGLAELKEAQQRDQARAREQAGEGKGQ